MLQRARAGRGELNGIKKGFPQLGCLRRDASRPFNRAREEGYKERFLGKILCSGANIVS